MPFFESCPDEILSLIFTKLPHHHWLTHLTKCAFVSQKFLRCAKQAPFAFEMKPTFENIDNPGEMLNSIAGRYTIGGDYACLAFPMYIFLNGLIVSGPHVFTTCPEYKRLEDGGIQTYWEVSPCESKENPLSCMIEWKATIFDNPEREGRREVKGAYRGWGSGWCGLIGIFLHEHDEWDGTCRLDDQRRMLVEMKPSLSCFLRPRGSEAVDPRERTVGP